MADDATIRSHISDLVNEERDLRERLARGEIDPATEHARLQEIEVELDQSWDLLRQRDAKREFHQDPAAATIRPAQVVEHYEN